MRWNFLISFLKLAMREVLRALQNPQLPRQQIAPVAIPVKISRGGRLLAGCQLVLRTGAEDRAAPRMISRQGVPR